MADWQPIETAPEGIAEVLLYSPRKKMVWIGYRTEHVKTGEVGWVLSQLTGGAAFCPWPPTHWMPLPAPPNPTP